MIHCKECEHYHLGGEGEVSFTCDPFGTIKEPECLLKWQLIKINQMVASYQATIEFYRKIAPLQEKMFKVMEREIGDMDESEKWKVDDEEEDDEEKDPDEDGPGDKR